MVKDIDEPPPPQFFHEVDQVMMVGAAFADYRLLPNAGGVLDQDEHWWLDIVTYMNRLNYMRQEVAKEQEKLKAYG